MTQVWKIKYEIASRCVILKFYETLESAEPVATRPCAHDDFKTLRLLGWVNVPDKPFTLTSGIPLEMEVRDGNCTWR